MKLKIEEVYRTEGVPEYTFVYPPNFNDILVDLRNPRKPVIIEGQSGTGKTTTVKKILETEKAVSAYRYLTARDTDKDLPEILKVANGEITGAFVIDDFHRLAPSTQEAFGNLVKLAAEDSGQGKFPKIIIIGINNVGRGLIQLVHDIAKRCGIHRIGQASRERTIELITKGEQKLNVEFTNKESIVTESGGDYWLTQLACQTTCLMNDVLEAQDSRKSISSDLGELRKRVTIKLEHAYSEPIKEFCRGRRFRSTNDPYLKLLKCVSDEGSSIVDLTELANSHPDVRGSINNIKENRLATLIQEKKLCAKYFYYNQETKQFAVEDPAMFYYLKHQDWDRLRKECGFRDDGKDYEFDFAISFAGENRELARTIAAQLEMLDCSVFFDEYFEANYLGKTWRNQFKTTFKDQCRFVVCLLDQHHDKKIWPTFERECFTPRIADGAVLPIFLDDTVFLGIPHDIVGIKFKPSGETTKLDNEITDQITWKLHERLQAM